ncbi:AraC family transcriptional regulator [Lederbergia wuyishanensis]|uniref:AraC-like DNA-binding protein n=1 Tax=Lederbergia wuyishanensis TaxID=1347903 RepID=A0ABU0D370_9BACI|nr:AraC family transcriptional regulator [Lederbergia wuyishanensis]MCJ8008004.1 AraC family transcriptional regulator [Lederbergia wuyishanensis]MDQ0342825.1 AraC-like DNA-binding protein [Lederbergia wuyishanensis]
MRETKHELIDCQFYFPSEFDLLGGVWPLKVGNNIAKPNYHIGPRVIEHFSIHFVVKGKVLYTYKNQETVLEAGDIFAIFPHMPHQYQTLSFDSNSLLEMHWLAFNGPTCVTALKKIGMHPEKPFLKKRMSYVLKATLENMQQLLRNQEIASNEYFRLYQLLYQIFYGLADQRSLPSNQTPEYLIQKSLDFIRVHYDESITVEEVAHHVGLHRSYFSKIFTEILDCTPRNYIQKLKMEKSYDMMQHNNYSITEIALSVGYSDAYSFSRAFKKYFGEAPTIYMKERSVV